MWWHDVDRQDDIGHAVAYFKVFKLSPPPSTFSLPFYLFFFSFLCLYDWYLIWYVFFWLSAVFFLFPLFTSDDHVVYFIDIVYVCMCLSKCVLLLFLCCIKLCHFLFDISMCNILHTVDGGTERLHKQREGTSEIVWKKDKKEKFPYNEWVYLKLLNNNYYLSTLTCHHFPPWTYSHQVKERKIWDKKKDIHTHNRSHL